MPAPIEVQADITRTDWLDANRVMLAAPHVYWDAIRKKERKGILRAACIYSPFIIAVASYAIGNARYTQGMYVEGAIAGAAFCLIMWFGLANLDNTGRHKAAALRAVKAMDLSQGVGRFILRFSESGIEATTPTGRLSHAWTTCGVWKIEGFFIVQIGATQLVMPFRAFPSAEAVAEFFETAMAWWKAGQLPLDVQVACYLADRDLPCPKCKYNLKGIGASRCPECGEQLTIGQLVALAET